MNKIGVYTSGGDAPGMNACVRAVVRTAIFNGLEVKGIKRGYEGMISNDIIDLDRQSVANIIQRGGTFLKTARSQTFMTKEGRKIAYDNIKKHGIDALVCVGGNGSYTGAKIFGITTGQAVMKINYELGYKPVHFSELTDDPEFWKGCQTCKNFDVLTRTDRSMCLCTGMLHEPNDKNKPKSKTTAFLSGLFKKKSK